jgi:hypothetical protein
LGQYNNNPFNTPYNGLIVNQDYIRCVLKCILSHGGEPPDDLADLLQPTRIDLDFMPEEVARLSAHSIRNFFPGFGDQEIPPELAACLQQCMEAHSQGTAGELLPNMSSTIADVVDTQLPG